MAAIQPFKMADKCKVTKLAELRQKNLQTGLYKIRTIWYE